MYLHGESSDICYVAELINTPQLITVLAQYQIIEAGKVDLKGTLLAQASITLALVVLMLLSVVMNINV